MAEARWYFEFTDSELEAIYTGIENAPSDVRYEEAYERVIDKLVPAEIGKPPAGALVVDDLVERGARALDGGLYAQFEESYKRQVARSVLSHAFRREQDS